MIEDKLFELSYPDCTPACVRHHHRLQPQLHAFSVAWPSPIFTWHREVWLLRTLYDIMPVITLVSLTWILQALRSFRRFTLYSSRFNKVHVCLKMTYVSRLVYDKQFEVTCIANVTENCRHFIVRYFSHHLCLCRASRNSRLAIKKRKSHAAVVCTRHHFFLLWPSQQLFANCARVKRCESGLRPSARTRQCETWAW